MEKNTVCIDLEHYNELRDFVKNIENGKIYTTIGYGDREVRFYTKDEAIELARRDNERLGEIERSARREAIDLRNSLRDSYNRYESEAAAIRGECNEKIEKIMKMSIWEFRRWKKSRV